MREGIVTENGEESSHAIKSGGHVATHAREFLGGTAWLWYARWAAIADSSWFPRTTSASRECARRRT